jgi:cytoskeletal protein RodZ
MMDVSSRLREARERAGLSIEDISGRTKIKVAQLQAIERGEFERLPGPFFTRAFLKNYAREVRLSPDEIAREYDAALSVPERGAEAAVTAEPLAYRVSSGRQSLVSLSEMARWSMPLPSPRSVWPPVALALVLLIVISAVNRQPGESAEPRMVSTAGAVEASRRPAATTGASEQAPEILTMEIAPTALIWINAKADGLQTIYRLVHPGERLKIEARNDFTFRIGNAEAFQYTVNGVPGRPLGASGEVVEFQVTRENFRTYRR